MVVGRSSLRSICFLISFLYSMQGYFLRAVQTDCLKSDKMPIYRIQKAPYNAKYRILPL